MGKRQVTVETPLGTREVVVDPVDERQRWRFLAGATAFAAYLDAQDGDDDPDLLADVITHWWRTGEAGTRRPGDGLAVGGVAHDAGRVMDRARRLVSLEDWRGCWPDAPAVPDRHPYPPGHRRSCFHRGGSGGCMNRVEQGRQDCDSGAADDWGALAVRRGTKRGKTA